MLPTAPRWIVKSRSPAGSTLNCSNSEADNSTLWAVKGSGEVCCGVPYGDRLVWAVVAADRPGPSLDGPPGNPTKYAAKATMSPAATVAGAATVAAGLMVALAAYFVGFPGGPSREGPGRSAATTAHTNRSPYGTPQHTSPDPLTAQSVELSASEFEQFKVEPAGERDFTIQRGAVGNIAFNEEMSVPVFPPVQGKIITLFARAGDDVKRGMSLYTI